MLIYEVNLTVDGEVATEYSTWLREHIREMLKLDGFEAAAWYARSDDGDVLPEGDTPTNPRHWTVHYQVDTRADLREYFDTHAQRMRKDGAEHFEGHVDIDRRVLEQKRTFSRHNPDRQAPGA